MSGLLDRHRRIVVACGLAISVVSALVFIPKILNPATASATAGQASTSVGFTPVPRGLDLGDPLHDVRLIDCFRRPVAQCTVVHGSGKSILLMGDSHAAMLLPTFVKIATDDNLTLSVSAKGLCPWQRNLYGPPAAIASIEALGGTGISAKDCKAFKDDLYGRVIPALHPDIIVAMDYADAYPNPETATVQSLRQLARDGRKVILVEDIPKAPFDPRACLSQAKVLEQCRYIANSSPTPLELIYRKLDAEQPGVYSADFDRLVCPFLPICDPVVNGQAVKLDQTHLTVAFAESIAPRVNAYLEQTVISTGS